MLKPDLSRRSLIKGLAATALAPALLRLAALGEAMVARRWHSAGRRRYTQVCLPHQPFRRCYGGCHSRCGAVGCAPRAERRPGAPVDGERSALLVDKLKANGLTLGNLMIDGFPNTLYARPGREEEIEKVKQSIQAALEVEKSG